MQTATDPGAAASGGTPSAAEALRLDEFTMPTFEEWKAAAVAALKGAPFEKVMFTKLVDGLKLNPIYNQEDAPASVPPPGAFPYRRGVRPLGYADRPWDVAQTAHGRTPADFRKAAHAELHGGSTALTVDLSPESGTLLRSQEDWTSAFEGVVLSALRVYFVNGGGTEDLARLVACCEAQGGSAAELTGGMLFDPLAQLAAHGRIAGAAGLDEALDQMASMLRWASENACADFTVIGVDGSCYQDAGASALDEVAFMLSTAVCYLRAMEARGLSVETAASRLAFRVGVGSNLFLEVAKMRALRQLWAEVVRACGGSDEAAKIRLHAVTSGWTLSAVDPWVNILRATTQSFASVLGGADSLDVRPFDEAVRAADEFSAHIARNIQLMLAGEFNLDKVADPAGGSFYVERLTDDFAHEAYARFQALEASGGMSAALAEGRAQAAVDAVAAKRLELADQRRQGIVGVNKFVNVDEKPLDVPEGAAKTAAADESEPTVTKPLARHRLAERFEALHARARACLNATGSRPRVFLANQGPLRQYKARADFSLDFLRAGGFDVVYPEGAPTPEDSAAAVAASGCKACVLCSTDDTYPELTPRFCAALREAAPGTRVLLAGYPAGEVDALRAAGVDDFIHVKANCREVLAALQDALGI